jgi:hypothetical protein
LLDNLRFLIIWSKKYKWVVDPFHMPDIISWNGKQEDKNDAVYYNKCQTISNDASNLQITIACNSSL